MKVLLDEQLPHRLRRLLGGHNIFTVDFMGWAGHKNGALLRIAESEGFDVFLTGDKNMSYQQNLAGRRMAIVLLSAIDLDIIRPHVTLISAAINRADPGAFIEVECGRLGTAPSTAKRQK